MAYRFPLMLVLVWLMLAAAPTVRAQQAQANSAASSPHALEAAAIATRPPIVPSVRLTAYRSEHYLIHTNLSRQEAVPFGRHMDAVFEQYRGRFRGFVQRELDPMPLYLLRTREDYIRFMADHDIDARNSGGMFFVTHGLAGLATWAESGSRSRTFRVLQHEGFHQFAWNYIGPNLPVWVNEGLAQYFEDAVLVDGRLSAGLTRRGRIDCVRDALEDGHALSLTRLNGVSSRVWNLTLRDEPASASVLYAQSWSVVYYLIHGEGAAHQDTFVEYLKLLSRGNASDEAMLLAFGREGVATVEHGWRAFALAQAPDDLAAATERLEFLGTGLALLNERGEEMPESMDQLRDTLRRYGFRVRRREMGVTRSLNAGDEAMFSFRRGSATGRPFDAEFRLLGPSGRGLPPRIVAPGLSPEPTLVWFRDEAGELVQEIEYR